MVCCIPSVPLLWLTCAEQMVQYSCALKKIIHPIFKTQLKLFEYITFNIHQYNKKYTTIVIVSDVAHQMKRFLNVLDLSQAFILRRGHESCLQRASKMWRVIGQIVCPSYSRGQGAVLLMLKCWYSSISANCNSSSINHFLYCVLSSLRVDYKCSLKLKAIPYKGQKNPPKNYKHYIWLEIWMSEISQLKSERCHCCAMLH